MKYRIVYKKSVDRDLRKLPIKQRKLIVEIIQSLAAEPHPSGVTKMQGSLNLFRLRHSVYRIIYQVKNDALVILIIKVGHRRDVYRNF